MKIKSIIPELIVSDMKNMIAFYCKYFDFELELAEPDIEPYTWVQLSNNANTIMMQEVEVTKKEIPNMRKQIVGTDLLMFKIESVEYARELYERFSDVKEKIYMEMRMTEYGSCEFGVVDPEGRYIIISG